MSLKENDAALEYYEEQAEEWLKEFTYGEVKKMLIDATDSEDMANKILDQIRKRSNETIANDDRFHPERIVNS